MVQFDTQGMVSY